MLACWDYLQPLQASRLPPHEPFSRQRLSLATAVSCKSGALSTLPHCKQKEAQIWPGCLQPCSVKQSSQHMRWLPHQVPPALQLDEQLIVHSLTFPHCSCLQSLVVAPCSMSNPCLTGRQHAPPPCAAHHAQLAVPPHLHCSAAMTLSLDASLDDPKLSPTTERAH